MLACAFVGCIQEPGQAKPHPPEETACVASAVHACGVDTVHACGVDTVHASPSAWNVAGTILASQCH